MEDSIDDMGDIDDIDDIEREHRLRRISIRYRVKHIKMWLA